MDKIDQLREVYLMTLENHQANIQILKNQKGLLQQHISIPQNLLNPADLIEETDNILRMITSGKYKP